MDELGTKTNPFTDPNQGDYTYRWCRCFKCDTVSICTPEYDFYEYYGHEGLWCENCMLQDSNLNLIPEQQPPERN